MIDRLEVGAYFVTKKRTFRGRIDEWVDITVCGTTYVGYGGIKTDFVDREGEKNVIQDVLVDLRDFSKISRALEENDVGLAQDAPDAPDATCDLVEVTDSF